MGPPPAPSNTHNAQASNSIQSATGPANMNVAYARGDNVGVGVGPGPMRHPRPLTAAELHLQLEKEQEAVVNRLTRELSQLRAQQSASVASTTSSASLGLPDVSESAGTGHVVPGSNQPPLSHRQHQRSSSNASARSITTANPHTSASSWTIPIHGGIAPSVLAPHPGTILSQASTERVRGSLSRQNSMTSSRRSGASSPSLSSAHSSMYQTDHLPANMQHHRQSYSSNHGHGLSIHSTHYAGSLDPGVSPTSAGSAIARYEEAAHHRSELEVVKRENDALRRRVRDLELLVRSRRQSTSETGRSTTSDSTSVSVAGNAASARQGSERPAREGLDEPVRVGESAGSAGT
ncbi:MAG: hypothetical protein M1825_000723 [Sarcosagium campestre]|nr:MAG: hypothetical protein M1825_000723 [Sarcosagium campestre]